MWRHVLARVRGWLGERENWRFLVAAVAWGAAMVAVTVLNPTAGKHAFFCSVAALAGLGLHGKLLRWWKVSALIAETGLLTAVFLPIGRALAI